MLYAIYLYLNVDVTSELCMCMRLHLRLQECCARPRSRLDLPIEYLFLNFNYILNHFSY